MTMIMVVIDPQRRCARWVCAGHEPVMIYDPPTGAFSELCGGDIPLGIELNVCYHEFSRDDLPPGAIFLIGTDGIWEARNPQRQEFGKERIRNCIHANAAKSAQEIGRALEQQLLAFIADAPIRDDATGVIVKLV